MILAGMTDSAVDAPPDIVPVPTADGPAGTPPPRPRTTEEGLAALAETERIGDEIARLAAHLNAGTYRMLVLIRRFDEREGWGGGFRSCAHWLSWRIGMGLGTAREHVRVARALAHLPLISAAMERGQLSYSKVRALTRVARPDTEQALLDLALSGTAVHVEKVVRGWRRVDRAEEAAEEELRHERRFLEVYPDEDGSWVLRGRLDPEVGAVLKAALDAGAGALYRDTKDWAVPQRKADAMGLVAERALSALHAPGSATKDVPAGTSGAAETPETPDGNASAGTPEPPVRPIGRAERYQVVVHVDASALPEGSEEGQAVLESSGQRLPADTARRIACDADIVVMRHDAEGGVLDVGRKTREVPPALRRALEHRDRGCRFPGCNLRYCDPHHIRHWADGGETTLENLALLCTVHHRKLHEGGFRMERTEGGEVRFYRPDGRPLPPAPALPAAPEDPVTCWEAEATELGLHIDERTTLPNWHGEPLDLHWAVAVMWRPKPEGEEHEEDSDRGAVAAGR